MKNISDTYLLPTDILSKAIEVLHKAGKRIALVVNDKNRLLGIITDGDIRRALLDRKEMDTNVQEIMSKSPLTASEKDSKKVILKLMKDHDILHVPIINSKGILVGLETITEVIEKPSFQNPVMIMAGGFGKRLLPLTSNTPKPLLKVGSKPLLESIIERFIDFGFNNFYISTHYKSDMIKGYFSDGRKWDVSIKYIEEDEPLGTGGAIKIAMSYITSEPFFTLNGDILTKDVNLCEMLDCRDEIENRVGGKVDGLILSSFVEDVREFGEIISDQSGKILAFREKQQKMKSGHINGGIYLFDQTIRNYFPSQNVFSMPFTISKIISCFSILRGSQIFCHAM